MKCFIKELETFCYTVFNVISFLINMQFINPLKKSVLFLLINFPLKN